MIVNLRDVSLSYPLYNAVNRSFKKALISFSTGGLIARDGVHLSSVQALSSINLVANEGDCIGLVGHNGAGKSSLLRLLAGVYCASSGDVSINGVVTSLLDISLGLEGEANGYENIILRGLIMGKTLKQIQAKSEAIAEFTELGEFLNLPLRTYSSGMLMRLAFSISTAWPSEILLMDEWLSVGDQQFAVKAEKRLKEMMANTKVIFIASHSEHLISSICNRKIVLSKGKIVEDVQLPT